MRLFDETTQNREESFNWDPRSIVGNAITHEPWRNVSNFEKQSWLVQLNSAHNTNTYVSKLLDLECFLTVILRGEEVLAKFIFLENFQRFNTGPIFCGPLNWPESRQSG